MFRRGPVATWFSCHTSRRCHGCCFVVFTTSPVSMASCAMPGWAPRCESAHKQASHALVSV